MNARKYVGVKHLSNVGGVGIVSIDYTDETVEYDVVWGDKVAYTSTAPIVYQDDTNGFVVGGDFHSFGDFMRV